MEWGVWSEKWIVKCGVVKCGVGSVKCGVGNVKCGCKVWSVKCGV